MAQFIKPPGYGEPQFRPTHAERLAAKRNKKSAAEKRDGMSKRHLELLRKLPCCITGKEPAGTVHHLKSGPAAPERGTSRKATDKWGVPLNWEDHLNGVERVGSRRELEWFQARGISDPYELAAALWRVSGNLEQMRKVLEAHMGRYVG